jgi:hypothetical protein
MTRLWQGPPRSFFAAHRFQRQKGVGNHHERDVVVPPLPASPLVMIQAWFLFELLIVLFDFPPAPGDSN